MEYKHVYQGTNRTGPIDLPEYNLIRNLSSNIVPFMAHETTLNELFKKNQIDILLVYT